jgi:hypothetical protein
VANGNLGPILRVASRHAKSGGQGTTTLADFAAASRHAKSGGHANGNLGRFCVPLRATRNPVAKGPQPWPILRPLRVR